MPQAVAFELQKVQRMDHQMKRRVVGYSFVAFMAACSFDSDNRMSPEEVSDPGGNATVEASPSSAAPAPVAAAADPDMSLPPGCASVLTPEMSTGPAELRADGPWQRCGAYGTGRPLQMRFAADGARAILVMSSGDAFVVTLPGLTRVATFHHGAGAIGFAALSPDGHTAATLEDEAGQVAIWDVDTGALVRVLRRAPAWPSYRGESGDLAFSSTGELLAVGSAGHLDVYEVATGEPRPISSRSDIGSVGGVAFVAHDTRLAIMRYGFFGNGPYMGGTEVDLVDATTGAHLVELPAPYFVATPLMAASRDGATVAVSEGSGGGIHFFDATTAAQLPAGEMTGELLALSPDGTNVALIEGPWRNLVTVRQVSDGALVAQLTASNFYDMGSQRGPIELTPDLSTVLLGDIPPALVTTVRVADAAVEAKACGDGHDRMVVGVRVSTDGTRLVSGADASEPYPTLVWDVASGARVDEPQPAESQGMEAASPDGQHEAVPRGDAYFQVNATSSGSPVALFGPHITHVRAVDWSPDGALLVSTAERDPIDRWSLPPSVKVWDFASAALVQTIEGPDDTSALFAPDGARLFVAGPGSVETWCY